MHSLIVGMSESGKTTLAKLVCGSLHQQGKVCAVLDPLQDEGCDADFQTQDSNQFLQWAKQNRSAFLFVDEGSVSIGRYNSEMEWLATMSRHFGHSCYFICQGFTQLAPIVRGQCRKVFLFACSIDVTTTAAREFNEPSLAKADRLDKGQFYEVSRFSKIKKGHIDFVRQKVYYSQE